MKKTAFDTSHQLTPLPGYPSCPRSISTTFRTPSARSGHGSALRHEGISIGENPCCTHRSQTRQSSHVLHRHGQRRLRIHFRQHRLRFPHPFLNRSNTSGANTPIASLCTASSSQSAHSPSTPHRAHPLCALAVLVIVMGFSLIGKLHPYCHPCHKIRRSRLFRHLCQRTVSSSTQPSTSSPSLSSLYQKVAARDGRVQFQ